MLTGATAQAELENPCGEWLNSKACGLWCCLPLGPFPPLSDLWILCLFCLSFWWVSLCAQSWQEVESLSKLSGFEGLPESFKENSDAWRAYFESQECQSVECSTRGASPRFSPPPLFLVICWRVCSQLGENPDRSVFSLAV